MPFLELKKGYPFPGAATKFVMPPGPDDWQPKSWGTKGWSIQWQFDFYADDAHFIDDGVAMGDVFYVMDSNFHVKFASAISAVWSQTHLSSHVQWSVPDMNVIYKIGMKAPHTLQTLQSIVAARGLHGNTAHWSTVWTQAPFLDFQHDENGDVYVCHNMGGRRLQELKEQWDTDHPGTEELNPWSNLNPEPVL